MKKVRLSQGKSLLPSLCTTASMFWGFFSIVRSINGDYYIASWAILVAGVFDMLDGRIARMTRTMSDFGKEYDSLVDLASFGLAPAILIYTWSLSQFKNVGWFFAFVYFACAALRLARFNVQSSEKKGFMGLPSPAAANLLTTFVLLNHYFHGPGPIRSLAALILTPLMGVLMVSHIGYRSFKEIDVNGRNSFYVLIGAAVLAGLIAIEPDIMMFVGFSIYALSGPVGSLLARRKTRPPSARSRRPQVLSLTPNETHKETGS